ncbi:lipopolysaccharide biosynthesis protein [Parabacteroides johnsonii]|jgi:hypothetical protein|uniref:lipopolysaccharide biosynthesis protein n=1 Tax=Parabacteroides johnsonii TaxID=387661 RepID=UPI00189BE840|nr:hypothetical protein [Parabacteroides johnsonii]
MGENSRTSNTVKNIGINFSLYFLTYIAVFVSRTYFVKLLGNEYLSLNGLFTNLITIVSFSELGLGSATIYCLYKPIAENDYCKINSYLKYFHKLYKLVIIASIVIAIFLIPAIPYIIDIDSLIIPYTKIVLFYCLFVVNTILTYFFVESKLFLIADQKNYIVNIIQQAIHIAQLGLQIIYLVLSKDFVGFLIIQILATFSTNILIHIYVKSRYKEVFQANISMIENNERMQVTSNIRSIFFYKIGAVLLNGTNNIIISSFVKTLLVGVCSNYLLIINAINSVLMQCFNGIGASIGNHIVLANKENQESVFRQLNMLCVIAFSFSSICLYVLINPLIKIWLGDEYLLDQKTTVTLILVFFVTGVNQIPSLYRTSIGLFKKARFYPLIAAITHIFVSIILAKNVGLWGVFLATILVRLLFFTCVDSTLVYKYGFTKSPLQYFMRYLGDIMCLLLGCIVTKYVCSFVEINSLFSLVIASVICVVIALVYLVTLYAPTKDFYSLIQRLKLILYKK